MLRVPPLQSLSFFFTTVGETIFFFGGIYKVNLKTELLYLNLCILSINDHGSDGTQRPATQPNKAGEPRPRHMMGFGLEIEIVKLRVVTE